MNDLEHRIQKAIVHYLRLRGYLVFAVPNGGARDSITGRRLKDEGVLSGVSDLIALKNGGITFIEVKTPYGRLSETQKIFKGKIEKEGHEYLVWRSLQDAVDFCEKKAGNSFPKAPN